MLPAGEPVWSCMYIQSNGHEQVYMCACMATMRAHASLSGSTGHGGRLVCMVEGCCASAVPCMGSGKCCCSCSALGGTTVCMAASGESWAQLPAQDQACTATGIMTRVEEGP